MALARLKLVQDKTTSLYKAQCAAADDIVTIAIISILLTAPIGAVLMRYLPVYLLEPTYDRQRSYSCTNPSRSTIPSRFAIISSQASQDEMSHSIESTWEFVVG